MPNRTLTLGQRTKDKVARDLLRDKAELPPPMDLSEVLPATYGGRYAQ